MRIAVTGHMNLTDSTIPLVREELSRTLSAYDPLQLTGISCLARGADTVFAEVVIDCGGSLEVLVPSLDYRERRVKPAHEDAYDALLRAATTVRLLPFSVAGREAYEAANDILLSTSDVLVAVWDGVAGSDRGGTAAAVQQARRRQLETIVVWPPGARRD